MTADFGGPYPRGADSPRVDPPPPVPPPVRSRSPCPSPHPVPRAGRRGVLRGRCRRGRRAPAARAPTRPRPPAATAPSATTRSRCSPGGTGTWSAASPTGSPRRWPTRCAAGAAPRSGSPGSSTRTASPTTPGGARAVVALPGLRPAAPLAGQHQGRQGRLGGDGRLPALGDDAADALAAPAPGGDGAVLGVAPARPDQRRPQLPLPQAVRRRHLPARARSLRPAARGGGHPPGDARLPRPGRLDQAAPQREPRRASCSRSTPSAPARCPRTTCRTWRGS